MILWIQIFSILSMLLVSEAAATYTKTVSLPKLKNASLPKLKNVSLLKLKNVSKRRRFAVAQSYLAIDLYKKSLVPRRLQVKRKAEQSSAIAPLSITGAFLALQDGLNEHRGADEVWIFLGYERSKINTEDAHAEYTRFLNEEQRRTSWPPRYVLELGNNIVSDTSLSLLKEYRRKMENYHHATVKQIEIFHDNPALLKEMNLWIKEKTRGSVSNMIDPFKSQTKMMILSTSYFMGKWETELSPKRTINAPFHCRNSEVKSVQMMQVEANVEYTKNDEYFAVELHFKGDRIRLFILCPKDSVRMHKFEEALSFEQLLDIRKGMTSQKMKIILPKVKIVINRKLNNVASQLQLNKIFIPDATPFGGMTEKDYMFVSDVHHSTVIDVQENFVTVSGVTTIAVSRSKITRKRNRRFADDGKCMKRTLLSSNSSGLLRVYSGYRNNASPSHFISAVILDEKDMKPMYILDDTNTWLTDDIESTPNAHITCKLEKSPEKFSVKAEKSNVKEVNINRPFLLAILHSDYDMIWFIGRVFECPET